MGAKEFDKPNWAPLEAIGGPELCEQFMWMWRESGIEFFKHIDTRRYLLLDSEGRCYRQTEVGFEPVDAATALKRVKGEE
jgi:hypothetical protein